MQIREQKINRRTFLAAGGAAVAALALSETDIAGIGDAHKAYAVTSAEKQAEADEVSAQLVEWQNQLNIASDNYFTALEEHDSAVEKMNEAQGRIDAAQEVIDSTQGKLSDRAVSMYKNGSVSYIDVLLGATSFDDFATTWDVLNELNAQDNDLIEQTDAAKQDAEDARAEYEDQAQVAQQKLDEAEQTKQEAEELTEAYQQKLDSLNEEVKQLLDIEAAEAAAAAAAAEAAAAAQSSSSSGSGSDDSDSGGGSYSYVSNGDALSTVVGAAYSQLGVPYVWGGTSPGSGLDCSGLTQYCYECAGIDIPRTSSEQRASAPVVCDTSDARAGDILWKSGHVAICIEDGGDGFIEEPYTGANCRTNSGGNSKFSCSLRYA